MAVHTLLVRYLLEATDGSLSTLSRAFLTVSPSGRVKDCSSHLVLSNLNTYKYIQNN